MKQIEINDSDIIGSGVTRHCYRHPLEKGLCIKIMKPDTDEDDINEREYRYYQLLYSRKASFEHIPHCYGYVDTNKGKGLVFDLIGENNGVSFEEGLLTGQISLKKAQKMFQVVETYLFKEAITFIDTGLGNLIMVDDKLMIIDGLVPPKPKRSYLYSHVKFLSRWRTKKSLTAAKRKIELAATSK